MGTNTETALAKREVFNDVARLQGAIKAALEQGKYIILTPNVVIDFIPEFHSISVREIKIDCREMYEGGEVYSVGGKKYGLSKGALDRIAMNMGIGWDPRFSGRTDDRSEPLYCSYKAVGWWPDFDGKTVHPITGEASLDLRDGSALCQKLQAEAEKTFEKKHSKWVDKGERYEEPVNDHGEARIREMRAKIQEHTESRAKNRAIRGTGIKGAWAMEDLRGSTFIVMRLVETGYTNDPELKKIYWEKRLEGKNLAVSKLFGDTSRGMPALTGKREDILEVEAVPITERHAPPPVGATPADEDFDPDTGEVRDDDGLDPFGGGAR
jgi:hypothetical protein